MADDEESNGGRDHGFTGKLANEAWEVVERPIRIHMMKSRWVFAVKYKADGSINTVKARFVACGYSQREGSDYDKVFAATLPGVSLRVLVACIADEDLVRRITSTP